MKEVLELIAIRAGDTEDYIEHHELTLTSLDKLVAHIGRDVEIWTTEERWLYMGPHSEEDHGKSETHAFGTLIEVNSKEIVLAIKAGEIGYDFGGPSILTTGRMEIPIYRHQFKLRRRAEIVSIDELSVGDQTFQWGRVSGQEQGKALA